MEKKSQFLYQFQAFLVNSNSIPIPFYSIPIPSPIPGIESGVELNSHSIAELTQLWPYEKVFKAIIKAVWTDQCGGIYKNWDTRGRLH